MMSEDDPDAARTAADLQAVFDIPVHVSAVLGKANMQVSQLLKLGRGAVVELDRKVGEAIDIYVNNRLVARGEVVVVEDRLGGDHDGNHQGRSRRLMRGTGLKSMFWIKAGSWGRLCG